MTKFKKQFMPLPNFYNFEAIHMYTIQNTASLPDRKISYFVMQYPQHVNCRCVYIRPPQKQCDSLATLKGVCILHHRYSHIQHYVTLLATVKGRV